MRVNTSFKILPNPNVLQLLDVNLDALTEHTVPFIIQKRFAFG